MKKSLGAKTLVYPTPVFVVGTYDKSGKPNLMTAAWGGICCSSPPCVAVSLRKATYSYGNLMESGAFTLNIPAERHAREADYIGIYSGRTDDKFAVTGLTPVRSLLVNAPYVEEFPLVLECKIRHTFELGLHTQFVGEIMDVKADEPVMGEKGTPDIEKVRPILFDPGNRGYYGIGPCIGQGFAIGKALAGKKD
jgi:flavin reductase (DIM6/NTAB) family NADH-FMN oxidoreductase RutF